MVSYHHIDKWGFANLDMIEEVLEKEKKAIVLVAGASSSGKSYMANYLKELLNSSGHKAIIISLDQYNHGLSGIIPNKVNQLYFNNKLANLKKIKAAIKKIIYNRPFDNKYDEEALSLIKPAISKYLPPDKLDSFLSYLNEEWKVLNFDEPTVYNLHEAAEDVKKLMLGKEIKMKQYSKVVSERVPCDERISGQNYDVIIVEGIYALDNDMVKEFKGASYVIKDFIECNPKSLFIRRIIRDAKMTSADNVFTISIYFKFILKSYLETIYPNRLNADIILYNDMTFSELRAGDLYTTKDEIKTNEKEVVHKILATADIKETAYQRDIYFSAPLESLETNNVLRLRCLSSDKGKTYYPSSLVHKGNPKLRRDNKIIRPINVLLKEGEFNKVWKDEADCLKDFLMAGFYIGPVKRKIKYRLIYKNLPLVIRDIDGEGYYIEFERGTSQATIDRFEKALKAHKLP